MIRQALVAAEKATRPLKEKIDGIEAHWSTPVPVPDDRTTVITYGDLRRAREAHALIQAALAIISESR